MKSKLLLRTNLLLCAILTAGFAAVSLVNYPSTIGRFRQHTEYVSKLTSESIYYQIDSYFATPISVAASMGNDSLLKSFLSMEKEMQNDGDYQRRLQVYLNAYRDQDDYDLAFLVSAGTNRYYRFSGLDRELERDNPENAWFFSFLEQPEEYVLGVDNDAAQGADQALTLFVNCKIYDDDGGVMGVVGVGVRVDNLRKLLQGYEETYGIRAMLIDPDGDAVSSKSEEDDFTPDMLDNFKYATDADPEGGIAEINVDAAGERKTFWVEGSRGDRFVTLRRFPAINWRLVVEDDFSEITAQFMRQLILGVVVTALIALAVLVVVNKVVMAYNDQLLKLVMAREMEYNAFVKQAAGEMYRDVSDEKERASRLIQDSQTDPLTGLNNRRVMEMLLAGIMRRLSRSRGTLSVLMIDVDFFKKYNDAYGHGMGDACLRDVAEVLRGAIRREGDFVARYGGEEFIVVLPDTDAEGARLVAETLLQSMIARAIPHRNSDVAGCVTLSIGGATGKVERAHDMKDYLKRADEALYASKANGRNRYTGEMVSLQKKS